MSPMTCAESDHVYFPMYSKEPTMKRQLMREMVGGESYEYVPLGKFVVSAPAICRGRPTFKDTRIEVAGVLARLAAGHTVAALITGLSRPSFPRGHRGSRCPGCQSTRTASPVSRQWNMTILDEQLVGYGLHAPIARCCIPTRSSRTRQSLCFSGLRSGQRLLPSTSPIFGDVSLQTFGSV